MRLGTRAGSALPHGLANVIQRDSRCEFLRGHGLLIFRPLPPKRRHAGAASEAGAAGTGVGVRPHDRGLPDQILDAVLRSAGVAAALVSGFPRPSKTPLISKRSRWVSSCRQVDTLKTCGASARRLSSLASLPVELVGPIFRNRSSRPYSKDTLGDDAVRTLVFGPEETSAAGRFPSLRDCRGFG